MPSYRIKPYPAMVDPNIRIVEQPVDRKLCEHIRQLGEDYILQHGAQPGRVGFNEATHVDVTRRNAETQWLLFPWDEPRTGVIYEAMEEIVQQVNSLNWQFDLSDYQDMFHYIRYQAPADHTPDCLCGEWHSDQVQAGHFQWHKDAGDMWRRTQRKLSFTLLLSDSKEYEGGAFEFFDGEPIRVKERTMGDVLVFPATLQHRVTPVTKGVRRSLVGWASGPKLR